MGEPAREKVKVSDLPSTEYEWIDKFLADVRVEFLKGRKKFPGNEIKGLACAEEFGELIIAMISEPGLNVYDEAVDLAATALRIVIDGDSSIDDYRRRLGLDSVNLCGTVNSAPKHDWRATAVKRIKNMNRIKNRRID
jgi:hypothetical protein